MWLARNAHALARKLAAARGIDTTNFSGYIAASPGVATTTCRSVRHTPQAILTSTWPTGPDQNDAVPQRGLAWCTIAVPPATRRKMRHSRKWGSPCSTDGEAELAAHLQQRKAGQNFRNPQLFGFGVANQMLHQLPSHLRSERTRMAYSPRV